MFYYLTFCHKFLDFYIFFNYLYYHPGYLWFEDVRNQLWNTKQEIITASSAFWVSSSDVFLPILAWVI